MDRIAILATCLALCAGACATGAVGQAHAGDRTSCMSYQDGRLYNLCRTDVEAWWTERIRGRSVGNSWTIESKESYGVGRRPVKFGACDTGDDIVTARYDEYDRDCR